MDMGEDEMNQDEDEMTTNDDTDNGSRRKRRTVSAEFLLQEGQLFDPFPPGV